MDTSLDAFAPLAAEAVVFQPAQAKTDRDASRLTLSNGESVDLAGLSVDELEELQWREEREFARRILAAPSGSAQRAAAFRQGYDTVLAIYRRLNETSDEPLAMGIDSRYQRMLVTLVERRRRRLGRPPRFFEVGYGSGLTLAAARAAGATVAGIEVSELARDEARARLGADVQDRLFVGDLLTHELDGRTGALDIIYWNDVFEHIPPDESLAYLCKLRSLLAPGGLLITFTPNWHMRPSDVTCLRRGPRSEAEGFHLKEYTLRETTALLRRAGFRSAATPLVVTKGRVILLGGGLATLKRAIEPALEWLPFRAAVIACRALGLSCTIATK